METIGSRSEIGPQSFAMNKATEVPQKAVERLLESAQELSTQIQKSNGSELTGIGQNLDIKG